MFDTDSPTDICGVGVQGGTLIEMTREMVKQIECDYWREKESPIDMAKIFDLAQKALDQEPTTKNDLGVDLISRADALDCVNWGYSLSNVYEKINELPSVTPIRPKGHWITKPHVYGATYCSECDFELKIDDTNYCPNCGAKMVEPQESEVDDGECK